MRNGLKIKDGEIRFLRKGSLEDIAPIPSVNRFIHVFAGDDMYANDCEAFVVDFGDRYWVIPEIFDGMADFFSGVVEPLTKSHRAFTCTEAFLPRAWWKKFLGVIPYHSARAQLIARPLTELSKLTPLERYADV